VDLDGITTIYVPEDAVRQNDAPVGEVQIFMEKHLAFIGDPPEAMSIRWARNYMGCASKRTDEYISIATYGEWRAVQGEAKIRLLIKAPGDVRIVPCPGFSGENSQAHQGKSAEKVKEGYWFGPASPGEGWESIPSVPDPHRTAGS
jgi:hypothetical protein